MRYEGSWYNDCYIKDNQVYYIGAHRIKEVWVESTEQGGYITHDTITLSEVFIETNGVRKFFSLSDVNTYNYCGAVSIIPDDDSIYYLFQSTYETGDTDQLGFPHHGQAFYISKNGLEPEKIADNRELIYDTRKAIVHKCKKINGKFYMAGTKDDVAFFCEANELAHPLYLSGRGGGAYDFVEYDSTILVCGAHEKKAYLFDKTNLIELPLPEGTKESEARCMAVVGNDLYVGGRADKKPIIWKNGEILAIYDEFPPVVSEYFVEGHDYGLDAPKITEEFGWVCAMEIIGDTIYSIVETSNWVDDHKRFALEWYFDENRVTFDYKYDLVEMLRNGQVVLQGYFYSTNRFGATTWNTMVYGTPRIAPRYVKAKRKK